KGRTCARPLRPMAPGPGRSATRSRVPLPVDGMQKLAPSFEGTAAPPRWMSPAGDPVSLMHLAVVKPKAPAWTWPPQKSPPALVRVELPVASPVMPTGSGAWNPAAAGGQARLVARLPTATQAAPAFGPVSHFLPTHFGHGSAKLPVTNTRDESGRLTDGLPVAASPGPRASVWITLSTQVGRTPPATGFGIRSGGRRRAWGRARGPPAPPPQPPSFTQAEPVFVAPTQCMPGPAPLVQSAWLVPTLAARLFGGAPMMSK